MINRVLIRIRVLQIFFSWSQREVKDIKKAETELMFSLQKSYDLYHYLLQLMIELTDEYEKKVEMRKAKLLPSEQDKNPNTKLINNLFILQLRNNLQLQDYIKERPFLWSEHDNFVRSTLNNILESELYNEYIQNKSNIYDEDKTFWRKAFKQFVVANEDLCTLLEDSSIYWNDDIEIVESFALKTIKQSKETDDAHAQLLPMFKDDDDLVFAKKLLREALFNGKENHQRIDKYAANWELERISLMDTVIMQIALAEIQFFPSIPISVTLNEYINIAKNYSTEKSSSFINGVLDSIIKELKDNNEISKN